MASRRLTKDMRHTFVKAVMTDVPAPDESQCSNELQELLKPAMPPEAVALLTVDEGSWLESAATTVYPEYDSSYRTERWYRNSISIRYKWLSYSNDDFPQAAKDYLENLRVIMGNRERLRDKIGGIAEGCTTIAQLKEALPDMAKYAPDDTPPAKKNMPVVANLMAEVVAMGWPGGKIVNAQIVQGATA
jgi:hypothetical protein